MTSTAGAGTAACTFHFEVVSWEERCVSNSVVVWKLEEVWEDKIVVGRWLVLSIGVALLQCERS
jgi:hypothetical protein